MPHASLGFTLLEILVALAVAGIVLSALFAVYARVMDAAEQVQSRAEILHAARLGLAQLAKDLQGVSTLQNATGNQTQESMVDGQAWLAFQGRSPEPPFLLDNVAILSFPTASDLTFSGSFPGQTLYRVVYTLNKQTDQGGKAPLYELRRRQTPLPHLDDPTTGGLAGSDFSVMRNILELTLRFSSGGPSPTQEEWGLEDQGSQQPGIPAAVQVGVILQGRRDQKHRLGLTTVLNPWEPTQ